LSILTYDAWVEVGVGGGILSILTYRRMGKWYFEYFNLPMHGGIDILSILT